MPSRHTSPATTPSRRDTTSTPRASPATTQAMTTAVARQLRRWRQGDDDNYVQGGQDKDDHSKVTMTYRRRLRPQQSGRESATATTPKPPQYQVAATPLHHSTRAPAIPQVPATSATPSTAESHPKECWEWGHFKVQAFKLSELRRAMRTGSALSSTCQCCMHLFNAMYLLMSGVTGSEMTSLQWEQQASESAAYCVGDKG
ncbi:hypothetical protein EDB84DRAFT_1443533 [Lactarius hengduanensis]|nr:hypothetical protein EDB84DRAFT_1443533 [Lactarius hengduanensis]